MKNNATFIAMAVIAIITFASCPSPSGGGGDNNGGSPDPIPGGDGDSIPVIKLNGTETTWDEALAEIRSGTNEIDNEYIINVTGTHLVDGFTTFGVGTGFGSGRSNITVFLKGKGTLRLDSNGSIIRLGSGQTLIIDGPTLEGKSDSNTASLVHVLNGARLELQAGTISGNNRSNGSGGGVYLDGGTFIMISGTISGNTASSSGGGVIVYNSGSFTMSGGTIRGNTAASYGGGVCLTNTGIFTKTGGTIYGQGSGNNSNSASSGHAVYWTSTPARYVNATLDPGDDLSTNSSHPGFARWQ